MNEEMLRGLTSRRSNRAFAPEQITDEELHKVGWDEDEIKNSILEHFVFDFN